MYWQNLWGILLNYIDIYKAIAFQAIESKIKPPTAQETWINIYPFLETVEWSEIYLLSYKITKEPYFQSLDSIKYRIEY